MDDDVADRLEKMKLTISISDGLLEAIESCNLSLIGKFLTCKPFNRIAAETTIWRAWGLNESM